MFITCAVIRYLTIHLLGDGDCFYRGDSTLSVMISLLMRFSSVALAFAYLDRLLSSPERNKEHRLAATTEMLAKAGFDDCVYGQPYEILQSLVQPYGANYMNAKEELWRSFTDPMSAFTGTIEMGVCLTYSPSIQLHRDVYASAGFCPDAGRWTVCRLPLRSRVTNANLCRRFLQAIRGAPW